MLKFGLKGLTRAKLKGHIINCVRLYVVCAVMYCLSPATKLSSWGMLFVFGIVRRAQFVEVVPEENSEDYPRILFIFSQY